MRLAAGERGTSTADMGVYLHDTVLLRPDTGLLQRENMTLFLFYVPIV